MQNAGLTNRKRLRRHSGVRWHKSPKLDTHTERCDVQPTGISRKVARITPGYTRCNCKYHIVFVPKYRRQVFYREKRRATGSILRKLCEWKSVRILEAECCADYIHMLVEIPPKMSVSGFMGYLKGKSSLMLYEQFGYLKFKYRNRAFWCRGYYVDTVGKNSRIFLNEYKPQMVKQTSPPRISVACIAREHAVVIKTGVIG